MDLPYILKLSIAPHMNLYDTVSYAIGKLMPKSYAGPHLSSILIVELIDSRCPSSTAPVLCFVFYVIITTFFNDTSAYLISFSSMFIFLQ